MLTLHRHEADTEDEGALHPWEARHAAPEDRAVGLELELIELVQRRSETSDRFPAEQQVLDRQIDQALAELDRVADEIAAHPLAG